MKLRFIEITPDGPKLMGAVIYQAIPRKEELIRMTGVTYSVEYIHHEIFGDFNDCAIVYVRRVL